MNEQEITQELLEFFKSMADVNRLKIVGLLAQGERSVEETASLIGLSISTTSHHLARLAKAGLVKARVEGHYYYYSFEAERLQQMAKKLLHEETLPSLAQLTDGDAYDRKVLKTFTDEDGRITAFPAQEKKYLVLLRYVVKAFEKGKKYSEKEVNDILTRYNEDTASLRRYLVAYYLMDREGGGGSYWRID